MLTERDVVLEERSQRVDNDPGSRLGELVNATQYLNHPYRLPVIGWRHEMASYTREDALDFYRTWYAPNNAVLIVAGDIDAAELRPLAEKYYGAIPARPVPERQRLAGAAAGGAARGRARRPAGAAAVLIRSYLAPSFNAGATEHAYPLEVLAEILGGTSTSRLYRALVIDQKLATSAGAYYRGTALDLATFRVYASPRPGRQPRPARGGARRRAAPARRASRSRADEVARATSRMIAEAVYARDSLSTAVRSFGAALATGGTVEDVEAWPERIGAVTADAGQCGRGHVLDARALGHRSAQPAPVATAALAPAAGAGGRRPPASARSTSGEQDDDG